MLILFGLATFATASIYLINKNSAVIYPLTYYLYQKTTEKFFPGAQKKAKKDAKMHTICTSFGEFNYLNISYVQRNKEHKVIFPYKRSEVVQMTHLKASLVFDSNVLIDITQEPGVPYFLSANHFGAKAITFINTENGSFYSYEGDSIPMYVEELKNCE